MRNGLQLGASFLQRSFRDDFGFPCSLSGEPSFEAAAPAPPEVFSVAMCHHLVAPELFRPEHRRKAAARVRSSIGEDDLVAFFVEPGRLPADVDCTAVAILALARLGDIADADYHRSLSAILRNVDASGVVQVYLDPGGPRDGIVDPVVAVNVLLAANRAGRAAEALATERFVRWTLAERSYLAGSRYYESPDTFLYLLAMLTTAYPMRYGDLRGALSAALEARANAQQLIIERAQWAAGALMMNLPEHLVAPQLAAVKAAQRVDGSWHPEAFFRYGRKRVFFGSAVLSTSLALSALLTHAKRQASSPVALIPRVSGTPRIVGAG